VHSHNKYSPRFWTLAAFLPLSFQSTVFGQSVTSVDTVSFDHSRTTHHVEAGFNALGAGLTYRYQLFPWLSADALASGSSPGIAMGVTVSPLGMFFVQGIVGTGTYEDAVTVDGPPAFKPTYLYGWIAGTHLPIAPKRTRLYFIFAFGQLKYVQNHYNYNGGGFMIGPPATPLYRTETRVAETISVGLGLSF